TSYGCGRPLPTRRSSELMQAGDARAPAATRQSSPRLTNGSALPRLHPLPLRQPLDAQLDGRGIEAATPGAAAVAGGLARTPPGRSEEHTSELQSRGHLVC